MRVFIGGEFSGVIREAFRKRGHDAWSCDLLPAEDGSKHHFQDDLRDVLRRYGGNWDLEIYHPDCTYHTNASVRWFTTIPDKPKPTVAYGEDRWLEWQKAMEFFKWCQGRRRVAKRVVIENPIMHKHSREGARGISGVGRYSQIIHPWQFGHKEMKATCLWLYGVPKLRPTNVVGPPSKDPEERKYWAKVHRASPGPDRWMDRSRTLVGIAEALAIQLGGLEMRDCGSGLTWTEQEHRA